MSGMNAMGGARNVHHTLPSSFSPAVVRICERVSLLNGTQVVRKAGLVDVESAGQGVNQ